MGYVGSYVWKLRQALGSQRILVPSVWVMLLNKDGKVWLGKRRSGNEWGLFGGVLELGDSVPETACKEVLEETGVHIQPEELVFAGMNTSAAQTNYTYPTGDEVQFLASLFVVKTEAAITSNHDDEHTEFAQFDFNELPQDMNIQARNAAESIRRFLETGKVQIS